MNSQRRVAAQIDGANQEVAHNVAVHMAAMSSMLLTCDEVAADVVESERRIAAGTAQAEAKPEAAMTKFFEGRLTGFFKGIVLVDQPFAKDSKKSVAAVLSEALTTRELVGVATVWSLPSSSLRRKSGLSS